jgi:photosystem II stability/assembly factor-like uncharacterized protein
MTVRPSTLGRPIEADGPPPPEVLFEEARRRRRRRWARALAVVAVTVAGAGIGFGAIGHGGRARASRGVAPASSSTASGTSERVAAGGSVCGIGTVAVTNCLVALSFVSPAIGFGVYSPMPSITGPAGPADVVATTDGGTTWHEVGHAPVGDGPNAIELPTLTFVDRSSGIEVGTHGAFVTHDGGRSWTRIPHPGRVVASTAVGRRLWLTDTTCTESPTTAPCSVGVETSNDAGRTWKALNLPPEPFRAAETAVGPRGTLVVAEWADQKGYVSNDPGVLLVSADGGASWQTSSLPCPADFRLGGQLSLAPTSRTLWLICSGAGAVGTRPNVVYRSTDLGTSWVAESSYPPALAATARLPPGAPTSTIDALVARSRTDAWVLEMTRGGLLATDDGGRSWHDAMPPSIERAIGTLRVTLDVVSPTRAYVAAHAYSPTQRGGLWRTGDGGRRWQRIRSHSRSGR